MAMKNSGPTLQVAFRRRREGVTDYSKRLAMLTGKVARLVVRRTQHYVVVQIVQFTPEGDKTVASATSKELSKMGFTSLSKVNTPAAYLTGMIAAGKAVKKGVKNAVVDLGRQTSSKGSILYAAAKGAADGGLEAPLGKDVIPSQERIEGKHLNENVGAEFTKALEKIKKG